MNTCSRNSSENPYFLGDNTIYGGISHSFLKTGVIYAPITNSFPE